MAFRIVYEWSNPPLPPYARSTSRKLELTHIKSREIYKTRKQSNVDNINFFSKDDHKKIVSNDYSFIKLEYDNKEICFIMHAVPDSYNPNWSKKLGIEYRNLWGIPKSKIREKIGEIVSFLLGRQLIKIGETKFDSKGNPIEELLLTPKIDA